MKQLILVITVLMPILAPGQNTSIDLNIKGPYNRQNLAHHGKPILLTLNGLQINQNYQVSITDDTDACTHRLQFNAQTPNKSSKEGELHFKAVSSSQTITFLPGCDKKGRIILTTYCESCEGSRYEKVMMGVTTTVNEDIPYLVEDVLVDGECFNVFNISSRGANGQIGTFANGGTSVGFEEGIIMSTGHIDDAVGPNSDTKTTSEMAFLNNDPDLRAATNYIAPLFDVAIIEFDFVPTVEQVTFEYVFASEEYCEYANTNFNDAFGFFIRGPGINGSFFMNSDNIAQIPDNGDYVSVNTVNLTNNSTYFHDNTPPSDTCYSGEEYAINFVEYDGFTTVLTAVANVQPCSTYHIKMAIADLNDKIFDSAVFLKAKSFRAGAPTTIMAQAEGEVIDDLSPYEGCGSAYVVFERVTADLSEDYDVTFTLSPSSTATPGLDFSPLPDTITIPAGQATDTLFLDIYSDQLQEGVETIILDLNGACSCITRTVQIDIHDPPPIEIDLQDQSACLGETVTLNAVVSGGTPGFTYTWDDGTPGTSIQVTTAEEPDTLTFTVTDFCEVVQDTSIVVSAIYPNAQIVVGTDSICNGNQTATLPVEITGNGPFTLVYEFDGVLDTISGITDNQFELPADNIGTYSLIAVDEAGCPGDASTSGEVFFHEITLDIDSTNISCNGADDGQVQVTVNGGTGPFVYDWAPNLPDTANLNGLTPGNYEVMVTDAEGCFSSIQTSIAEPAPLQATVASLENIDCEHPNGGIITVEASGGTGNYTYAWSNTGSEATINDLPVGNYTVTITDENDCTTEISRSIVDLISYPQAEAQASGILDCIQNQIFLSPDGSTTGTSITYAWEDSLGNTIGGGFADLPWGLPGTYNLIVTDTSNHCQDTATTIVLTNQDFPVVDPGIMDTVNCFTPEVLLDGSNSSTGPQFVYNWTTNNGNILDDPSQEMVEIDQGGTYYLQVIDTSNNCSLTDSVFIFQDLELPTVAIASFDTVNCYHTEILLDGTGSSTGPEFSYSWSTDIGSILTDTSNTTIEVNSNGTYTLAVHNSINGCRDSIQVDVLQNLNFPLASAGDPQELSCVTGTATIDATGSLSDGPLSFAWTTPNGHFVGDSLSAMVAVDSVGTYEVVVTDLENGCASTAEVEVALNSNIPVVSGLVMDTLDCDTPTVLIDASASTNDPGLNIQWSGDQNQPIQNSNSLLPLVSEPGTYTLVLTEPQSSCSSTLALTVTQDINYPQVDAGEDAQIDCFNPTWDLSGTVTDEGPNATITWSGPQGLLPNPSNLAQTIDESGWYVLSAENNINGCETQDSVFITPNFDYPEITAGADNTLNCQFTTLTLSGNIANPNATQEITWQSLNGATLSATDILTPVVSEPDEYVLTVNDPANGCVSIDTVLIAENFNYPVAAVDSSAVLNCVTPELPLDASATTGADQFSWSSNGGNILSGSDTPIAEIDAPGSYMLIATNSENFCQDTAMFVVTEDITPPDAIIDSQEVEDCELPSFLLHSTGSSLGPEFTYQWSTTNGLILDGEQEADLLVGAAGAYQLLIIDTSNGCRDSTSVQFTVDPGVPIAVAEAPDTITCAQPVITLDGTNSSFTNDMVYGWEGLDHPVSGNDQSIISQANQPGRYVLIVTNNESGCTTRDTVLVGMDTLSPIAIGIHLDTLTCTQMSANVSAESSSTGPEFTYSWSSPDGYAIENPIAQEATVSNAGQYELLVTDTSNGCTSVDLVEVPIDTLLPIVNILQPDTITCAVPAIEIMAESLSPHPLSPIWSSNEGNFVEGINTLDPSVDESGAYNLLITDLVNGCVNIYHVQVPENTVAPDAHAGADGLLDCNTTSLQLDGSGSSAGNYSYQWETDTGNIQSGDTGISPQISEPGTYRIIVTDNVNGCQSEDETLVTQDTISPVLQIAEPDELNCVRLNTMLSATSDEASTPYSYQWFDTNGQPVSGATGFTLNVGIPGTYQWTATNLVNGCSQTFTQVVDQNITPPVAEAGPTGILTCKDLEIQLQGDNSSSGEHYQYNWHGDVTQPIAGSNTSTPTVNTPGTYTLVVTDNDNGCTDEDEVMVIEEIPRSANLSVDSGPCFEDAGTILVEDIEGGFGPYSYSIDNGFSYQFSPIFSTLNSGDYEVIVRDLNGCEVAASANIPVGLQVEVEVEPLVELQLGDVYQIHTILSIPPSNISEISWTPAEGLSCTDCLNPIVVPEESRQYRVRIVSEEGCVGTALVNLVVDRRASIYIPNAFSPYNEDGINDRFFIFAKEGLINEVLDFKIFTRWGELVFEKENFPPNDPFYGWDGFNRGEMMNPGVFVYWTEIELFDGTVIILKGDLTLMR